MPRDGAGNYSVPPGTDGVTGFTIDSAKYNINVHDVASDLNAARPIVAGGTGGATAKEALVKLGGARAWQEVTDFNIQKMYPGLFWSASTASNGPVSGHAFAGICYTTDTAPDPASDDPANVNLTMEARDQSSTDVPGKLYVRQKKSSTWGAWTLEGGASSGFNGGVITGDLTISKASPSLILDKPTATSSAAIYSTKGGSLLRWGMQLGSATAETGVGNAGSDFFLTRYSDAGAALPGFFLIRRSDGIVQINHPINSAIVLDVTADGYRSVLGTRNSAPRWKLDLGDSAAESGSDTGSNFAVLRYTDGGTADAPFVITRQTGKAIFTKDFWAQAALTVGTEAFKPGGGPFANGSDSRIKNITGDYVQGLAQIKLVMPRTFTYKANEVMPGAPAGPAVSPGDPNPRSPHYAVVGKTFIGAIAQEIETAFPEMVTQTAAEIDGAPVTDLRMLDTTALVYALVNACKEMASRIEALEAVK